MNRRGFIRKVVLASAATAYLGNEALRRSLGFGVESPVSSFFSPEHPVVPFSPPLLRFYFQTGEDVPGAQALQEMIKEKITGNRPRSVCELIKLGFEGANTIGLTGEEKCRVVLFSLAAVGQLNPDNAGKYYPVYIPDGRQEEPGWDKSVHVVLNAFLAYELLRLADAGEARKANEFLIGLKRAIWLVGRNNISLVEEYLGQDNRRSFPFSPSIGGLTQKEAGVASLLAEGSIAFEVFTTIFDKREFDPHYHERRAAYMAWLRLTFRDEEIDEFVRIALDREPENSIVHGLCDPGVNRDLVSDQVGIALGISLYRRRGEPDSSIAISEIPLDDHSQRFGYWEGPLDKEAELIGPPPKGYFGALGYNLAINPGGKIILSDEVT